MEVKDLRVGNVINFPFINKDVYVLGVNAYEGINGDILYKISTIEDSNLYCEPISVFKPIPISEQWLLEFGFKKIDYHRFKIVTSETADFHYTYSIHDNCFRYYVNDTIVCISTIFDVHELQNLYFALTQTELTLS